MSLSTIFGFFFISIKKKKIFLINVFLKQKPTYVFGIETLLDFIQLFFLLNDEHMSSDFQGYYISNFDYKDYVYGSQHKRLCFVGMRRRRWRRRRLILTPLALLLDYYRRVPLKRSLPKRHCDRRNDLHVIHAVCASVAKY